MVYRLTDSDVIIRTADGASIPNDPGNRDRIIYNAWVAGGGVPDPYVAPTPTANEAREQSYVDNTERQGLLDLLKTATPDQITTYIANNVTDLASARVLLRKIVLLLAIVVRR